MTIDVLLLALHNYHITRTQSSGKVTVIERTKPIGKWLLKT